jgi:hypothetical protein
MKALTMLRAATVAAGLGFALAGCVTAPVDSPCGVIKDPLSDVHATTPEGNRRIDDHFERGVRAGCWKRSA